MVILATDGAVEAKDSQQNMFGFERLQQAIATGPSSAAQAMLEHLIREVTGFIVGSELQDDFSIAVVRIKDSVYS